MISLCAEKHILPSHVVQRQGEMAGDSDLFDSESLLSKNANIFSSGRDMSEPDLNRAASRFAKTALQA